jgi:hypothetical protein
MPIFPFEEGAGKHPLGAYEVRREARIPPRGPFSGFSNPHIGIAPMVLITEMCELNLGNGGSDHSYEDLDRL